MRKQTVENQYMSALYKFKKYIRKGVPNLDENEKKDFEELKIVMEVCKAEIDQNKPKPPQKKPFNKDIDRSHKSIKKTSFKTKKKAFSVFILPETRDVLVSKFGNLTMAIESLIS